MAPTPNWASQPREPGPQREIHIISSCESVRILFAIEKLESAKNSVALFKGQCSDIIMGSGGGRVAQSGLESCRERLGCVTMGRDLEGQSSGSLY